MSLRIIVLILFLLFLGLIVGCQPVKVVSIRGSVVEYLHEIPSNSLLQLTTTLTSTPKDKVLARFQGGALATQETELSVWYPICALVLKQPSHQNYKISPTTFNITKVDHFIEEISEEVKAKITELSLQSNRYPEIEKLVCELWVHDSDPTRLGDFIKVAEFHSTTNDQLVVANE